MQSRRISVDNGYASSVAKQIRDRRINFLTDLRLRVRERLVAKGQFQSEGRLGAQFQVLNVCISRSW